MIATSMMLTSAILALIAVGLVLTASRKPLPLAVKRKPDHRRLRCGRHSEG